MAVRTHCKACIVSLRQQSRPKPTKIQAFPSLFTPCRPISASSLRFASAAKPTSPESKRIRQISPVVPTKVQGPMRVEETAQPTPSPSQKIAQEVRKLAPAATETYVAYGVCETLVRECARVADYKIPQRGQKDAAGQKDAEGQPAKVPTTKDGEEIGVGTGWWYDQLGLTPTFNTWAQITLLHMYLLTTRIRCFPAATAPAWHQHLIDHFSYLAEERMIDLHNIQMRASRNRYLKDLFVQWRGLMAAYDEGIVRGDAVLATAVWRNICKADEEVDLRRLVEVVSYMRSVLFQLDGMEEAAITTGDVIFGDPGSEAEVVRVRSRLMDLPFDGGLGKGEQNKAHGAVK